MNPAHLKARATLIIVLYLKVNSTIILQLKAQKGAYMYHSSVSVPVSE